MSRNADREKLKNKVTSVGGSGSQASIKAAATKKTGTTTTPKKTGTTTVKKTGTNTVPAYGGSTTTKGVGSTIPGTTTPSLSGALKSAMSDFAKSGGSSWKPSTSPSRSVAPGTPAAGSGLGSGATAAAVKSIVGAALGGVGGSGVPTREAESTSIRREAESTTPQVTAVSAPAAGGGYSNGGLSAEQIRELQAYYGTDTDGMWGGNSVAAAGGLSAREAWNAYQTALQERELENLRNSLQQTGVGVGGGLAGGQGTQTGEADIGNDLTWEEYLELAGKADYEQKIKDAVAAQVQQAIDSYNKQIEQAASSYEDAARRVYISSMLSRRNMDQELAASGVYGGMADSQRIALEADYQNGLTDLESQYNDTVAQVRQAITSAQLAGDAQSAERMADYLSQLQSQYAQYLAQREQERATSRLTAQEAAYNSQLAAQKATSKIGAQSGGTYSGSGSGSGGSGGASGETGSGQGLTNANYSAVKNNIMLYASRGMTGVANRIIQQAWGQMNAAQQNELVSALRSRGWSV